MPYTQIEILTGLKFWSVIDWFEGSDQLSIWQREREIPNINYRLSREIKRSLWSVIDRFENSDQLLIGLRPLINYWLIWRFDQLLIGLRVLISYRFSIGQRERPQINDRLDRERDQRSIIDWNKGQRSFIDWIEKESNDQLSIW